jgi:hypothetical protein
MRAAKKIKGGTSCLRVPEDRSSPQALLNQIRCFNIELGGKSFYLSAWSKGL